MSSPRRLVIRIKLPAQGLPQAPVRRRWNRGALLLILGAVEILLTWVGISMFRTDPTPAPAVTAAAPKPEAQSAPPVPARSEAAPETKPVESEVRQQSAVPPSPVIEVIPDVPRSARETIRGTIRVSIRVIVEKEGTVLAATADERGPSRYFERLAVEAAKKWTFTPADSAEQRVMLIRFYFKRSGTTARAIPLEQ